MKCLKYLFFISITTLFLNDISASTEIRLSFKVILNPYNGERPAYMSDTYFDNIVESMNAYMCTYDRDMFFSKENVIEIGGMNNSISQQFYNTSPFAENAKELLESLAEANPSSYAWRQNRINLYFNNGGDGGKCSFPGEEIILVGGPYSPELVLHEIGHYFALCHTQGCPCGNCSTCGSPESDNIGDTSEDRACWNQNDISQNAFNKNYSQLNSSQKQLVDNSYFNIMSYHSNEYILTDQQLNKWIQIMTSSRSYVINSNSNLNPCNPNDDCDVAINLSHCNLHTFNLNSSTATSSNNTFSCYSGPSKDIWFKTTPSASEIFVETSRVEGGLTNLVMQIFTGTCGSLQEIACQDGWSNDGFPRINLSGVSTDNPIYIRITDYLGNDDGKFRIKVSRSLNYGSPLFSAVQNVQGDGPNIHNFNTFTGDINNDGRSDIVFLVQYPDDGLQIRTKFSNGDGTYNNVSDLVGDGPNVHNFNSFVGDIDGDDDDDLVFLVQYTSEGLQIRTKFSNGDGTFQEVDTFTGDGENIHDLPSYIGDIDDDGDDDLVFFVNNSSSNGLQIRTKLSNGDGTWTSILDQHGDGPNIHNYNSFIGDVNNDGKDDIVFLFQNQNEGLQIRTKFSNGDGTFSGVNTIIGDGPNIHNFPSYIGDVDGDGDDDLVFFVNNSSSNGLQIRTKLSNGDGTWTSILDQHGDGPNIFNVEPLFDDFDGDGLNDVAFIGSSWFGCGLNIRVKKSNGDGTYCSTFQVAGDGAGVLTNLVRTGKFNNDNKADIVFTGQGWSGSNDGLHIRTKLSVGEFCGGNSGSAETDTDDDGFSESQDCNDSNPDIFPGQDEIIYNGVDDDCDSATLDDDLDQDGFGFIDDCDDNNSQINPNANDSTMNGIDENCDGIDGTVGVEQADLSGLVISPNPANDILNIFYSENINSLSFSIFDSIGRVLIEGNLRERINIKSLPSGVYFLNIQNSNYFKTEKIVVAR